jgi:cytoskeletal protein CcmA (bactofilin family)/DNA-directed RNA polymerase subunit RPC12/RpoP
MKKEPIQCPHCGHSQLESPYFLSTICSSCGHSIHREDLAKRGKAKKTEAQKKPWLSRWFHKKDREIHCFHCGGNHTVSGYAKTTICPVCSSGIGLRPMLVSVQTSRSIDIRAHLTVRKGAYLNAPKAYCTSATIAGKFYGSLICEEILTLSFSGTSQAKMTARKILVSSGANIVLIFPLQAQEVEVRGHLKGNIVATSLVRIRKGASVSGSIVTKSLRIDRGASYSGAMQLGGSEPADSLLRKTEEDIPHLRVADRSQPARPGSTI